MPSIFSPDALRESVHDTLEASLAAVPKGKTGAILIDGTKTADGGQAQLLVVRRFGENVAVVAGGAWDGAHVEGKFAIAATWGGK